MPVDDEAGDDLPLFFLLFCQPFLMLRYYKPIFLDNIFNGAAQC